MSLTESGMSNEVPPSSCSLSKVTRHRSRKIEGRSNTAGTGIVGCGCGAAATGEAPPPQIEVTPEENGEDQSSEDDVGAGANVPGALVPLPIGIADEAFEIEDREGGTTISSSSCRADEPKVRLLDDADGPPAPCGETDEGGRPMALPIGATLAMRGLVKPEPEALR